MTATLASYDSCRFERPLFLGSAGIPLARVRPNPAAQDPHAIAHIVHHDSAAATRLAELCRSTGIEACIHASVHAFAEAALPDAPACLLIHVRHLPSTELELLARRVLPEALPPVIVAAERADVRTAVLAMKAGAIEFFDVPPRDQDLLDVIAIAIAMDRARRRLAVDCTALRAAHARLTERERQVMALVTQGLLNKQVAGELGISEITVKAHRGAVMRKMGVRTLADLVRMADALAYLSGDGEAL
ncbi:response regulator transcription factor [Sphingomonas sp. Sphisp140]|uniref:response regulator transcription factor n=1 Tax=unclassified Sphingomonas TaxID=196159 RepID=UPI0039B007EE